MFCLSFYICIVVYAHSRLLERNIQCITSRDIIERRKGNKKNTAIRSEKELPWCRAQSDASTDIDRYNLTRDTDNRCNLDLVYIKPQARHRLPGEVEARQKTNPSGWEWKNKTCITQMSSSIPLKQSRTNLATENQKLTLKTATRVKKRH